MSISYIQANSEYLETGSNLIGSDVWTISVWSYLQAKTGTDQTVIWSGDKDDAAQYHRIQFDDSADAYRLRTASGTASEALCTSAPSLNTWHHLLAYSASATDRQIYMDNGSVGTDATSHTGIDALTDRFTIGRVASTSPGDHHDGLIGEVAVYNVAMTNTDNRKKLADKMHPFLVRPDALIRYFSNISLSHLTDSIGGATLSAFNTPATDENHPDIYRPWATQVTQLPSAVGVTLPGFHAANRGILRGIARGVG